MVSTEDIGIILTLVAICVAIYIAYTQYQHLKKLEYMGNQTKGIAEKLTTSSVTHKCVNDFFVLKDKEKNKQKKYKCFFPVQYRSTPFPLISEGDFYAIHLLTTYLGKDNLDLKGIVKDDSVADTSLEGNVIFICSPSANSALKKIFDEKK